MRSLPFLFLFGAVCVTPFAVVAAEESEQSSAERRTTIQLELDRNHEAIHMMYSVLDSIPASEPENRRYLESQIEEFDGRNNVLFTELDELDREQLKRHRGQQLQAYADRLSTQAARSDSPTKTAEHIEGKLLNEALAGDEWEAFIKGTWSEDKRENSGPIHLFVENVRLRAEVEALKQQIAALQEKNAKLEDSMEHDQPRLLRNVQDTSRLKPKPIRQQLGK